MLRDIDIKHLRRCAEQAPNTLAASNLPFGALLPSANNEVLAENCNQIQNGDRTHHPEQSVP